MAQKVNIVKLYPNSLIFYHTIVILSQIKDKFVTTIQTSSVYNSTHTSFRTKIEVSLLKLLSTRFKSLAQLIWIEGNERKERVK